MNLKPSKQLKIYLLLLSQTDCDSDVKQFVKRMYKSSLPDDFKKKIYPICKILSYYYQHSDKDISVSSSESQIQFDI